MKKQNWEYYCKKYNLLLDNENYDDLEKAFDEVEQKALAQQKEEIILEGEKSMARGVLRRIEKERSLEHIKVLCEAVLRLKL